jgi:hypothetical protein
VGESEAVSQRNEVGAELSSLLTELRRRRKRAFNVRHQFRTHPAVIALGATAVVAALVAQVLRVREARRRERRLLPRLRRFFARRPER